MYPLILMQVDFESWTELNLRLKMEKFIKEYISFNELLSTVLTVAV
jgi:hypothetical protein